MTAAETPPGADDGPAPRPLRTYKCEDELYDEAMAKAHRLRVRGGLSAVIRRLLAEWVASD